MDRPLISRGKVAKSAVWSSLEGGGLAALSFVSLIVYTHLLRPVDMGIFAIVLAVTEILSIFVVMPLHDALIQKTEVDELDYDTAFCTSMALSIVFVLICGVSAHAFSTLLGHPQAGLVLLSLSASFPLAGVSATIMARQRRELAFRQLAIRSLAGRIAGACLGIGVAMLGWGLWSLVVQQLTMVGAGSAVLWKMSQSRPQLRFDLARLRTLAKVGVPAIGTMILTFSLKRVFIVVIGIYLNADAAGYLNVAFRTVDMSWSLTAGAITQVALPVLSRLQGDGFRLSRAYVSAVGLGCTVLYPCFLGLAALAPETTHLLFGAKWSASTPYLQVLSCMAILQVPRMFAGPMLTAQGHPQDQLPGVAAEIAFLVLAIAVFGIPSGMWGVGMWVGCEVLLTPIMSFMLWRRVKLGFVTQVSGAAAPLFAALLMVLAITILRRYLPTDLPLATRFVVLTATGIVVYLAAIGLIAREIVRSLSDMVLGLARGA
jgi:PST family polysaccharide transporter